MHTATVTPFTIEEVAAYSGIDSLAPVVARLVEAGPWAEPAATGLAYCPTPNEWETVRYWPSVLARVVRGIAAVSAMPEEARRLAAPLTIERPGLTSFDLSTVIRLADLAAIAGTHGYRVTNAGSIGYAAAFDLVALGFVPGTAKGDRSTSPTSTILTLDLMAKADR